MLTMRIATNPSEPNPLTFAPVTRRELADYLRICRAIGQRVRRVRRNTTHYRAYFADSEIITISRN